MDSTILYNMFIAIVAMAVISAISFFLFALTLSLIAPIQFGFLEQWMAFIAPIIGGIVGAVLSYGFIVKMIYIVPLCALVGVFAGSLYETIIHKKNMTRKLMLESMQGGLGLGCINGVIIVIAIKILALTVGIAWLLPS